MTLNIKNKLLLALIALLVVMSGVQLWSSGRTQAEQAKNGRQLCTDSGGSAVNYPNIVDNSSSIAVS